MNLRVLDAVRGLAAVYVVAFHATSILWPEAPADSGLFIVVVRQLLGFGHEAVLLFFVVSGFCIHYRQARAPQAAFDLRGFAWRRARRLYPPLLLALAATSLFDSVGAPLWLPIYTEHVSFGHDHSPTTLLGNLLFQARLHVPEWGSNGPLWSLAHEVWFYALYPVMLVGFRRLGTGRTLLAASLVSVGCSAVYPRLVQDGSVWVLSEWAIWVAGAWIAELYAGGARPRILRKLGPAVCLVLAVTVAASPRGTDQRLPDVVWGAYVAVLLAYGLLVPPAWLVRAVEAVAARLRPLGDMSYSLYLLHQPWLVVLGAVWWSRFPARPAGPELALVGLATGVALGWLGWYLVERPGHGLARMPARIVKAFQPTVLWRAPCQIAAGRSRARVGHSARSYSPRSP
jgi:peptidoglycan/LPS O-acetylase OafA/YrhL